MAIKSKRKLQEQRDRYPGRENLRAFYDQHEFTAGLRMFADGHWESPNDGNIVLDYGFLKFRDAERWAGPFPGNHAGYLLRDCRGYQGKGGLADVEPNGDHFATLSHPFAIRLFGNDDTSYTACFRTSKEAAEVMELLKAAEPLHFNEIGPFGFLFSN